MNFLQTIDYYMKIILLSLLLCLFCSLNMAAQGSDIGSYPEDHHCSSTFKKGIKTPEGG